MNMDRITDKHLAGMISRLNRITNNPLEYSTRDDAGRFTCNVGHFHIDRAYGGNQLVQTVTDGGGIRNVLGSGHVPKRACYELLAAYIRGIEDNQFGE